MSEDTYTDGILDTPSQPDHSELLAEIEEAIEYSSSYKVLTETLIKCRKALGD